MKFSYVPRVLSQLGEELITDDDIAVIELLKNGVDAGANHLLLQFITSFDTNNSYGINPIPLLIKRVLAKKHSGQEAIVIEDDGKGMNESTLEDGFFKIGTDLKKQLKDELKSQGSETVVLGEKGLGRLAAQKLGGILYLETVPENSDIGFLVKISWDNLSQGISHICPSHSFKLESLNEGYTRLWIFDIRHDINGYYFDEKFNLNNDINTALCFFHSPFNEKDESNIINLDVRYDSNPIEVKFNEWVLNLAQNTHEFMLFKDQDEQFKLIINMEIKPWYIKFVHARLIEKGFEEKWLKDPHFYDELYKKYEHLYIKLLNKEYVLGKFIIEQKDLLDNVNLDLEALAPIHGKVYSFKRENKLFKWAADASSELEGVPKKKISDIRDFLNIHNGIKLYRGDFRIGNMGDKDNDWLHLQQARTKGQQFFRLEIGNLIGFVEITDRYQEFIREVTSRQGTINTDIDKSLKSFLEIVFNKYFYELSRDAYYMTRDLLQDNRLLPKNDLNQIEEKKNEHEKFALNANEIVHSIKSNIKSLLQNISMDDDTQKEKFKTDLSLFVTQIDSISEVLEGASKNVQETTEIIENARSEQKRIIEEAHDNYKLMANGLITETITHELHSIIHNVSKQPAAIEEYANTIKKTLIAHEEKQVYSDCLKPMQKVVSDSLGQMEKLNRFYQFLEKTFIRRSNEESIFIEESIKDFLIGFHDNMQKSFKESKINFEYDTIDMTWNIPKGSLVHLFYNLVNNSLYWINERQVRSKENPQFMIESEDYIRIEKIDSNSILFYDSGTGVLPSIENELFLPLHSAKKEGRGMGLYIIRNFLRSFGACISLLDERNQFGHKYKFIISINCSEETDSENEGTI